MDSILNELLERIKHLPLTRQAALIEYIDSLENETVSASEAARMLRCDRQTVIRMINRGDLPASKRGRNWLIQKKDIEAELEKQRTKILIV
ncbi:MAG TPA: helix-turn-helix domain-containing protein [Thermotogota bacterium]|nr:helix-turn-helix domain-containing protein [Thermotogota bacterium]HQN23147.1 helix-turn-helix domain-containing protein [Thermotogota bacterium]